jgi:hypothetical protein
LSTAQTPHDREHRPRRTRAQLSSGDAVKSGEDRLEKGYKYDGSGSTLGGSGGKEFAQARRKRVSFGSEVEGEEIRERRTTQLIRKFV